MVESLYLLLHLQMAIRNRSRRNLQEEAIVPPYGKSFLPFLLS